jgi:signal peptidase II
LRGAEYSADGGDMKERMKHLFLFLIIVGVDQAAKYWIRLNVMNKEPLVLIPKVLSLQYHENTGAVWGIMSGKVQFLSIFTFIILALILLVYIKIPKDKKFNVLKIICIFIIGGAVGNLIDRVVLGHVVDFIYFEPINFPLFNIADCCLTVSCILLFILSLTYYKEEDFTFLEQLFGRKKVKQSMTNPDFEDQDQREASQEDNQDEGTVSFDRDIEEESNNSSESSEEATVSERDKKSE